MNPQAVFLCRVQAKSLTPLLEFFPLGVDASNLLMGGPYRGHDSLMGFPSLESNCEPDSAAGIFPLGGPNLLLGFFPFRGLHRHSADRISPTWSRHIQSIMSDTPLQASFQFACKRSIEPIIT